MTLSNHMCDLFALHHKEPTVAYFWYELSERNYQALHITKLTQEKPLLSPFIPKLVYGKVKEIMCSNELGTPYKAGTC